MARRVPGLREVIYRERRHPAGLLLCKKSAGKMPTLPAVIRVIREICGRSGFVFNPKTEVKFLR